jgi:hypothetical protein
MAPFHASVITATMGAECEFRLAYMGEIDTKVHGSVLRLLQARLLMM